MDLFVFFESDGHHFFAFFVDIFLFLYSEVFNLLLVVGEVGLYCLIKVVKLLFHFRPFIIMNVGSMKLFPQNLYLAFIGFHTKILIKFLYTFFNIVIIFQKMVYSMSELFNPWQEYIL